MNGKTNLSDRMQTVFDMVEPCTTALDVGCDHGFVSMALISQGVAKRVIACDINEGPLKGAGENIEKAGLSEYIETRLSDGLHKVNAEDKAEAIVIAGMGGALMVKILSEGPEIVKNAKQLILQPQSELFLVRQYVRKNGFHIEKEAFLLDAGKFYWVMDVRPGEEVEVEEDIREIYDLYSGYLIQKKDTLLKSYLESSIITNKGYLSKISEDKQSELKKKIEKLQLALNLMGVE